MKTSVQAWEILAESAQYKSGKLAKLLKLSPRQLQRQFKCRVGHTPRQWLDEQRIKAAQKLLLTGLPTKEVAATLGFRHSSHFCTRFRVRCKMTPTEYVARQLAD